jgi:hypothetical protein
MSQLAVGGDGLSIYCTEGDRQVKYRIVVAWLVKQCTAVRSMLKGHVRTAEIVVSFGTFCYFFIRGNKEKRVFCLRVLL